MGLLDDISAALPNFLPDDPQKREAAKIGLLNFGAQMLASANQGFGVAAGNALQSGTKAYSQSQKDALDMQQKAAQAAWMKQVAGEMGGQPGNFASAALTQGAANGSVGPTMKNAGLLADMEAAPRPAAGPSLRTLQQGAMLGMKNIDPLFAMHKYQQDGIERKPGTWYQNPTTGEREYVQDPSKGTTYDPKTNSVAPISGFNENVATLEGGKTRATEQAKAGFDLLPLGYVGTDGRPLGGTRGQYIDSLNVPAPQAPQAPQRQVPPRPTRAASGFPVVTPQEQRGRDVSALGLIQAERDKETNPQNIAALDREIARMGGKPVLQSKAEETAQVGTVKGRLDTNQKLNDNWVTASYNPVVQAGRDAHAMTASLDAFRNIDIKTGWGTEAKAAAASVLTGLGVAPKNAEMFAANAQKFQSVAMGQLQNALLAQKGPQTEGDAQRAGATLAQLKNTPQANLFINDFARAKANLDARRAQFYQEALPLAQQEGDLNVVDRRWQKLQGSIWSDPALAKWKGKK